MSDQVEPLPTDVPPGSGPVGHNSNVGMVVSGPVEQNPNIEVDADLGGQSDYESASDLSETTTLASSIYDYKYENGRRYHKFRDGAYVLPNDEAEQDRLDIVHHIYNIMLDGNLTTAPIGNNPQRILDVGTGTGIWAIDAADVWPSAEVIGTDLSPIQPTWVPPNCRFEIDDCESEWTFQKNSFDFIHSRSLAQSIKDWPKYLRTMYQHTRPGGYIELLEAEILIHSDDNAYPEKCNLRTFIEIYNSSCDAMGVPNPCDKLKRMCEEAGFVGVTEAKYKVPWGPWPKDKKLKEMGKYLLLNADTAFEAYGLALLTRFGNKTPEEAKRICEGARADLYKRDIHVYNYHWAIVGKRPEE